MFQFGQLGFSAPYTTAGPNANLRERVKNVVRFSFTALMNGAALVVGTFGLTFGWNLGIQVAKLIFNGG